MSKSIFLCYRLTDSEIVERTKRDLASHGFDAWGYDDVLPGQSWRSIMNQALVEAEIVVVFLSPSFIEHEVCRQQVYIAQSLQKRILPIYIEPRLLSQLDSADELSQLKELNFIPFPPLHDTGLAESYDAVFAQLLGSIRPDSKPAPLNAQHQYVSFSKFDSNFVVQLCKDLGRAGIDTWATATSLRGGDRWRQDIARAVLSASNLVLVLSSEAIQSHWVRREVLLAQLKGIPVIPIVPPRVLEGSSYFQAYPGLRDAAAAAYELSPINDINWIYPEPDYDKALNDLIRMLEGFEQETSRKQGIFLSYRRADSRDVTGRVHDFLAAEFGADRLFQDVGSIPAGQNFVDVLHSALGTAAVMLVMIGPAWATITDEAGNRRLQNPEDYVRMEVQAALESKDTVVIPVLLDTTQMPSELDLPECLHELRYRQSIRLLPDPDFRGDMSRLVAQIRESQM